MRIIKSLSIQLTTLMVVFSLVKATGQPLSNTFLINRELTNIKRVLEDTVHKSFDATCVISYSDGTSKTVHNQYQVCGSKMHVVSDDSTEFIQGSLYNLLLKHNKQQAELSPPMELFKYVLQVDIMGAWFRKSNMSGMAVTDTGGYKKLSYQFKPASIYRQYDIVYDKTSYRIQAIQYKYNTTGFDAEPPVSKIPFSVTISFGNHQTGLFTDSAFSTSAYFIWKNGSASMVAPYTSYQLINSLNQ